MLEGLQEVLVEFHRLLVAAGREHRLLGEPVPLIHRSVSSLYAVPSSMPHATRSHFAATPGIVGCGRVSGDIDVGKLV